MRVLVVEDDAGVADVVRYRLQQCGIDKDDIRLAAHAVAAMRAVDSEKFCLVLLDQRLPYSDRDLSPRDEVGRDLLRYCRRKQPDAPVIVMTAYAGRTAEKASDTTVQLMKLGARDFIVKPFEQSPEPFEDKVRAALECAAPTRPAKTSAGADGHRASRSRANRSTRCGSCRRRRSR